MNDNVKHNGLWIDSKNFLELLDSKINSNEISHEEAENLIKLETNGFLIIKNAICNKLIDEFNTFTEELWSKRPDHVKVQTGNGEYKIISEVEERQASVKILDAHCLNISALQMSLNKKITHFLEVLFNEKVLASQNLTFQVGSTQAVHKDGTYVVYNRPLKFAASWIALEDVDKGSGELVYYPGSHKFNDDYFSGGRLHWDPALDGNEPHDILLQNIHKNALAAKIKLEHFLPNKGDALIWHPKLAHGGANILDPSLTRKSYVTHYCPISSKPNYFSFAPEHSTVKHIADGNAYSSWFYKI